MLKPSGKPRNRSDRWSLRGPRHGGNIGATVIGQGRRSGRGPGAGQRHGKDRQGTWEIPYPSTRRPAGDRTTG